MQIKKLRKQTQFTHSLVPSSEWIPLKSYSETRVSECAQKNVGITGNSAFWIAYHVIKYNTKNYKNSVHKSLKKNETIGKWWYKW